MDKKILVVVDMQNDFIDGALGTAEAQAIIPDAVAHIQERKAQGYEMIATLDTHGEDYMNTAEGKKLPVPHCIRKTSGWEINPQIREALGQCTLVEKPSFGSLVLPGMIRDRLEGADSLTIELMGLCTDICVVSNAMILKANFPEATLQVKGNCCAGVSVQTHEAALKTMGCCQIDVI